MQPDQPVMAVPHDRTGDDAENTAVQQSSSCVRQSSVQTLEPIHQVFKWTPLALM